MCLRKLHVLLKLFMYIYILNQSFQKFYVLHVESIEETAGTPLNAIANEQGSKTNKCSI